MLNPLAHAWMLFSHVQGTPQFRAHASKILNSFDYVIDALDKDPDMKEIAKMVAEGEHDIDFFRKAKFNRL